MSLHLLSVKVPHFHLTKMFVEYKDNFNTNSYNSIPNKLYPTVENIMPTYLTSSKLYTQARMQWTQYQFDYMFEPKYDVCVYVSSNNSKTV